MIISTATLAALRTTLSLRFNQVLSAIKPWSSRIASEIPSSNANNTYGWMANAVQIREWIGPRIAQAMREHSYVLPNKPWESTVRVPRENILDDNLGIYTAVLVPQFAEAVAKHPDTRIAEKVFAANPTCYDGKTFWASDHPTFAPVGSDQAFSNDFNLDLDPQDMVASVAAVETVRTAMTSIVGENGLIVQTDPRLLIVPPQLEFVAMKMCNNALLVSGNGDGNAAIDNHLKGMLSYEVLPELGAISATKWYLADNSRALKAFLWQVRSRPKFKAFDSIDDYRAFELNEYTYGIDGDDGGPYRAEAGVSLPHLCARSGT